MQLNVYSQSLQDEISTEEKIYGLSKVWSEVKYNFAFMDKVNFDIDSLYKSLIPKALEARDNKEYISVLRDFLRPFNNQKTLVTVNQWYWNEIDLPPIDIEVVSEKYYVKRIDNLAKERIPIGSQIISVDGNTPSKYLNGPKLSAITIDIVTPTGDTIQESLVRNRNYRYKKGIKYEMVPTRKIRNFSKFKYDLQNGYSIVTINSFSDSTVIQSFRDNISQINSSRGLIIDVSKNGGGNSKNAADIAAHLVNRNYLVGPSWKTRVHNAAKKAFGGSRHQGFESDLRVIENSDYHNNIAYELNPPDTINIPKSITKIRVPIVVIQSNQTVSAAEDFLIYLMGNNNIKRIGQKSRGNSGQPLKFNLSNGVGISIVAKRDALPNGEDYIGIGIKPDIEINDEMNLVQRAMEILNIK